jgi:predicted dehydrogenase
MSGGPPSSADPIAVAIVGGGIIGHNHAAAILRHPRLRVAAVVDPDAVARKALADRIAQASPAGPSAQAEPRLQAGPPLQYETLTATLADCAVDLVAVCTPSGLHVEAAEEALAAQRHVLIEKPLDVSLPRARHLSRLAADAEKRGLVATVVSQHRFDPASIAVASAVADGRFGRITSAVASVAWWRAQSYYDSAHWRGTWALDGGGAVMNQGVHTVDLLVWLLGQPTEVFAHTGRLAHDGIEVEDVAVATIRFPAGALGVLHVTTAAYPGTAVRLQIHGSRGSAVIHDDQLEYFHAAGDGDADNQAAGVVPAEELRGAQKSPDSFVIGHLRQYHDVVDAIDRRRPAKVRVDDGLAALAVVKALYLSATLARPIAVAKVLDGAFDNVDVATGEGTEYQ